MSPIQLPARFNEANAAALVIGEWNPNSLSCSGNSTCGRNLGNTYGVPVISSPAQRRLGRDLRQRYGSTHRRCRIYVMTVNPTSGARTFYYLSTGKPGSNGIASPSPADYDGDHITDYVYAGDLLGNVWRFDLTSSDPTQWRSRRKSIIAPRQSLHGPEPTVSLSVMGWPAGREYGVGVTAHCVGSLLVRSNRQTLPSRSPA